MLDFQSELNALLDAQTEPLPDDELTHLLRERERLLSALNKKQTDMSLQMEEIYDIIKDASQSESALNDERRRNADMLGTLIALCDVIEDVHAYAVQSNDAELERQTGMAWRNVGALLNGCGISRIGQTGHALDPSLHAVNGTTPSDLQRECVAEVLRSGYRYTDKVLRKAVVVVSEG